MTNNDTVNVTTADTADLDDDALSTADTISIVDGSINRCSNSR